jgi:hypothetical protein
MYYLVRDYYDKTELKIFSDKNDIEEWVDEFEDKPMLLVYSWEQGMYNDTRHGKRIYFDQYFILQKSENVFDLVQNGDLIKFNKIFTSIRLVIGYSKVEEPSIIVEGGECVDYDNINAIYKPSKHGNYIKVWEKEN